mgnify:FL=1
MFLSGYGQGQQDNLADSTKQKEVTETAYEAEDAQMAGNVVAKTERVYEGTVTRR